ncbi:hypothetical protein VPH35_096190 [Triticum aestivum]
MQPWRRPLELQVVGGGASMERSPALSTQRSSAAAVKFRRSCKAASTEPSPVGALPGLQLRSTGDAKQLRRSRRSSAGAAMKLGRSCNGASPERRSSAGAAMKLDRSCNGASPECRCCVGAPPKLQ